MLIDLNFGDQNYQSNNVSSLMETTKQFDSKQTKLDT